MECERSRLEQFKQFEKLQEDEDAMLTQLLVLTWILLCAGMVRGQAQ